MLRRLPPRALQLVCGLAAATSCGNAQAQTPTLTSTRIISLSEVTYAASPPNQPDTLYLLLRNGMMFRVNTLAAQPVAVQVASLNVSSVPTGGNGFIAFAFHPQFADNGVLYYTRDNWPTTGVRGTGLLSMRVAGAPGAFTGFDAPTQNTIAIARHSNGQHTGGWISFGPDGLMYMTTGDGHDSSRSQNTQNLSGKLLRLDVDGPDDVPLNEDDDEFPADADRRFCVPRDNPFAEGRPGGLAEIWATGLRNPFRGSFDGLTGELIIGDVGQSLREEVSRLVPTAPGSFPGEPGYAGGRNFGWPCFEGTLRTSTSSTLGCATITGSGVITPIVEYRCSGTLNAGNVCVPIFGNSVIGSILYRGCAMPAFDGRLFVIDYSGMGFSVDVSTGAPTGFVSHPVGANAYGLIQNGRGELFAVGPTGVHAFRQTGVLPADCDGNGRIDACEMRENPGLDLNQNSALDACECAIDFNGDGLPTPDDLDDYITTFFETPEDPRADFDRNGVRTPDDLDDYITAFFEGCA